MKNLLLPLLFVTSTVFAAEQAQELLEPVVVPTSQHAFEARAYAHNDHIPVNKFLRGKYAKPGDLWFSSSNSTNSKIIQFASGSDFSHVGMIWGCGNDNRTKIIHSDDTPEARRINPITGEYWPEIDQAQTGVVCHYLDELLYSKDKFLWLPLKEEFHDDFEEKAMEDIYNKFAGKAYDSAQRNKAVMDFRCLPQFIRKWFINKTDETQLFCSELIAAILKDKKLIPEGVITSELSQEDFLHWNDIELRNLDGSTARFQLQKLYDPSKAQLIDLAKK